jgi:hypothetical protein
MLDELIGTYPMTEKNFGPIPPLPSEGQRVLTGRYRTRLSDTIIGEERFNLEKKTDGRLVIFSQSIVNAPPRLDVFSMRLQLGESASESMTFESDRLEGRGKAEILRNGQNVQITAKMPGQAEIQLERAVEESTLFGCPLISTYVAINDKLCSLEVGQRTTFQVIRFDIDPEFEIIEARLNVQRKKDSRNREGKVLREYAIEDVRRTNSHEVTLVMGEEGKPVSFELVGQMGDLRADLIQPPAN